MNSAKNTSLFVDLSSTESADINGGLDIGNPFPTTGGGGGGGGSTRDGVGSSAKFALGDYIFMIGAGTLFGNPGLTQAEIQYAWEESIYF